MIKSLICAVRVRSVKPLLVAGLVACMSLSAGTAKADINLSTGINVTGQVDNLWTVAYTGQTTNQAVTLNPGFPIPPWLANSADSGWIVPAQYGQDNAPPASGSPIPYTYTTTFSLTSAEAAVATLFGKFLSDNNTISITLNGFTITPNGNSIGGSFTNWTDLTGNGLGHFNSGALLNTLTFVVDNQPDGANGNPTGFRFEGGVNTTAIPEPASLVMGALSTLALGGLSWKRRLTRRAV